VIDVTVYHFTGRQFPLITIPDAWCPECEVTLGVVRRVAASVSGDAIRVTAKPWLRHIVEALRLGGWHPPVVVVDGAVFSQGVVPDAGALRQRLLAALGEVHEPSPPLHAA
jgi:hypothetical protein